MSYSDKELLELAAKAAGISLVTWTDMYDACDEIGGRFITHPHGEPWNPLEEDGDALRLAVKLDLLNDPRFLHERDVLMFTKNMPRLEATRRAFVQAAAAQVTA